MNYVDEYLRTYTEEPNYALNPNSIISIGKYEILFASALPSNDYGGDDKGMQYINGASCDPNRQYEYEIKWEERGKKINSVDFRMQDDNAKLSTVFGNLPYGLIKKNRTGIGATTLELNSTRNSIVVVPTRALAYEKAKNSWSDEMQSYSIHYVGGKIQDFNTPSIANYLADNTYTYKKFIVVVDSLPLLLDKIGKDHFKDYFIMFDEIDCYQYDSSFRPNMETGFDYYFKFPETQRCLVSATVGKFTDPRINAEPIINLTFNNTISRNISLKETDDVLITTKKHIENILETHPNDKILVAFNLLKRGILPIIKSLSTEIQSKCGVLCSAKNKADVGEMYCDITEKTLPTQITFMTCTYFVGIDIEEPFHLISVADVKYPFTLLSTNKLQQIAGRCRSDNGILSETIVHNINNTQQEVDINTLSKLIVEETEILIDYYHNQLKIKALFPRLLQKYNIITKQDIVESSTKRYVGIYSANLIRQTSDSIQISFFNVDNILIQIELLKTLYSNSNNLKNKLISDGNNITNKDVISENEHISAEIITGIEEMHQRNEEEEREYIIALLRECSSTKDREYLAQGKRTDCMNGNSAFLEHFIELQKYVPFENLVELLPSYNTPTKYKRFKKQVIIWALEENHILKIAIRENFPVEEFFTGDELTEKFNNIWHGALGFDNLSNRQAVPMLDLFCEISARSSTTRDQNRINGYRILSYNPLRINDVPINRISSNEPMARHLR